MTVTAKPGVVIPPPTGTRPHPSTRGYWLGGVLTAAAVIGAVIWVVVAFFDYQHQIDRYPRMTVPGVQPCKSPTPRPASCTTRPPAARPRRRCPNSL